MIIQKAKGESQTPTESNRNPKDRKEKANQIKRKRRAQKSPEQAPAKQLKVP